MNNDPATGGLIEKLRGHNEDKPAVPSANSSTAFLPAPSKLIFSLMAASSSFDATITV